MGCPLSQSERDVLDGRPLSAYEQDVLDNMPPSQEWLSQLSALAALKPEAATAPCREHKPYKKSQRDILAAAKREKVLEWMMANGGMISTNEGNAIYGGNRNVIYSAMEILIEDGLVEVLSSRPRVWGLTT